MPFINQGSTVTVVVPVGQKVAIGSYGSGQTIISYFVAPNWYRETQRLSGAAVTLGTFTTDQIIKIEADLTDRVEYVIGVAPSLTQAAISLSQTLTLSLNGGVGTTLTNPNVQTTNSVNNFTQIANQNKSAGTSASADVICYPDNNANDITGFVDIGMCSSGFTDATYAVTVANDAYVFGSAPSGAGKQGNLVIATDSTGSRNDIRLCTNGFNSATNVRMIIKKEGAVNLVPLAADPASPAKGDIYFNSVSNKLKIYNGTAWETVTSA